MRRLRPIGPAAVAAAWVVMLGCSSTLQTPDGGTPPVDGRARPVDARTSADAAATLCFADGDCTVSNFVAPVSSAADCYCVACSTTALNRNTAAANIEQWAHFCMDWPGRASCPQYDCIPPPPVRCLANRCVAGSLEPPSTCPRDPANGCPPDAVRCAGVCCSAGEWCDQTIGACRCGFGNGCGSEALLCATTAVAAPDQCGAFCCTTDLVDCPR